MLERWSDKVAYPLGLEKLDGKSFPSEKAKLLRNIVSICFLTLFLLTYGSRSALCGDRWLLSPLGLGGDNKRVQSGANGALNVRQFGAQGNGESDDAPAVQKTINALGRSGGTVYIPAGTYLLGRSMGSVDNLPNGRPEQSALLLRINNVTLIGDGGTTILILKNRAKMRMLTITGSNDTIQNMVFDANKQGRDGSVGWPEGDVVSSVVNVRPPAAHVTFRNVEVRNGLEDGIGNWNIERNNCGNTSCPYSQQFGLKVSGLSQHIMLNGNSFINNGNSLTDQVIVTNIAAVNSNWQTSNTLSYNPNSSQGGNFMPAQNIQCPPVNRQGF